MATIRVSTVVPAPPEAVWEDLRHIGRHVEWMSDAASIRFLTEATEGVGVRFECDTVVGPLRLTDRMEVTDWRDAETMGIRHTGVVSGVGHFRLSACEGPAGEACHPVRVDRDAPVPVVDGRAGRRLAGPSGAEGRLDPQPRPAGRPVLTAVCQFRLICGTDVFIRSRCYYSS